MKLLPFLLLGVCLAAASAPASPLDGLWRVTHINLNTASGRRQLYTPRDRRILGKTMEVSEQRIAATLPEQLLCEGPSFEAQKTTLGALIGATFAKAKVEQVPSAKTFKLTQGEDREVTVQWVTCSKGDLGPTELSQKEGANWMVMLDPQHVLLRWYGDTILTLTRATPAE